MWSRADLKSRAKEILKVIGNYSKVLDLLDDYDDWTLLKPKESIPLVKNI